ncbi:hypothetical protein EAY21_03100 [Vibrio anguillarum]|nr:hypothetical protein [Vibrio anguillarum]MBF4442785.1 hypothetical protein [Vibrio anguillarum]
MHNTSHIYKSKLISFLLVTEGLLCLPLQLRTTIKHLAIHTIGKNLALRTTIQIQVGKKQIQNPTKNNAINVNQNSI